jgi:hypothetical protein
MACVKGSTIRILLPLIRRCRLGFTFSMLIYSVLRRPRRLSLALASYAYPSRKSFYSFFFRFRCFWRVRASGSFFLLLQLKNLCQSDKAAPHTPECHGESQRFFFEVFCTIGGDTQKKRVFPSHSYIVHSLA